MSIEVRLRNWFDKKKLEETIVIFEYTTLKQFREQIQKMLNLRVNPYQLGLTFQNGKEKVRLVNEEAKILSFGVTKDTVIDVKNLGLQLSWRLVYILEYMGPLVIFALFAFKYGLSKLNVIQLLCLVMSSFHYLKRVLESKYLHIFSRPTMPAANLLKNCTHYWILFGVSVGYNLFHPDYSHSTLSNDNLIAVGLFFFSEYMNYRCHSIQVEAKLKSKGEKAILFGSGFGLVSAANYFWEILAWLSFTYVSKLVSSGVFTGFAALVMSVWAKERHLSYKKTFGEKYPKNRKIIIPFLY